MIVVHGESIDAAALPALIAGNHQGLATYRLLGHDAELVTLDATPPNTGTGTVDLRGPHGARAAESDRGPGRECRGDRVRRAAGLMLD